nr:MAG: capsid protein [Cressdnaviricota sp.]
MAIRRRKTNYAGNRLARRNREGTKRKVNKLAKKVNQVIPYKNKYNIDQVSGVAPDFTGAVAYTLLCNPSQGVTALNRVGDRIRLHRIKWGITLDRDGSKSINNNLTAVRMMIIYDHENSFSNMTQLLNSTVNVLVSDYNQQSRPRWTLVKDKVYSWQPSTVAASAGDVKASQFYKSAKDLKAKLATFNPGATTCYHGQLKVFFASNATAGNGTTTINFYSEVYYSDVL